MALPSRQEITDHLTAVMDPDYLRVIQHLCEERLRMLQARRPIHVRPQTAVAEPPEK